MLTDILNYLKSGIAMWLKWIKPRSLLFALKIALATLLVWPLLSWLGIDHPEIGRASCRERVSSPV